MSPPLPIPCDSTTLLPTQALAAGRQEPIKERPVESHRSFALTTLLACLALTLPGAALAQEADGGEADAGEDGQDAGSTD